MARGSYEGGCHEVCPRNEAMTAICPGFQSWQAQLAPEGPSARAADPAVIMVQGLRGEVLAG